MKKRLKTDVEILTTVVELIAKHGYSPSLAELCEETHLSSKATISQHLDGLEDNGYITRLFKQPRTIRPTKKAYDLLCKVIETK